ncbi:MAG: UDP-glucose dehydrogenase family protein [Nocardioidaceae bacterium]
MTTPTRISVIGTGYLGATHAACMAELGFEVVGVDVDPMKVEALSNGILPFYEPYLEPMVREHTASGRLRFTTSTADAARFASVHFLGVGTPQQRGKLAADLAHVEAAVDALAPHLSDGDIVVGKSTVPVGTAARLQERLNAQLPAGVSVDMVWNPEFLREGFAVEDTLRPDRIVIGTRNERSLTILKDVHAAPLATGTPLLVTDLETAELVKTAANAFLATKISFINAMSEMCEATGADVRDLADAIGHDARIGRKFLGAGVGFGGGCLPKDIRAFRARADELGLSGTLTFLTEVDRINMRRRDRVITLAEQALDGSLCGRRIAILGAAFKPDSDDVRDSPGLDVAARLHAGGADVRVYDPMANGTAARVQPTLGYVESARAAISDAELVIVVTEWLEFIEMNPTTVNIWAAQPLVIDARNCLDADAWTDAGWKYMGLGRCHPAHHADTVVAHVPDNASELADGHLVG